MNAIEYIIFIIYMLLEYYIGKTKRVKENSLIEIVVVLILRLLILYKNNLGEKWKKKSLKEN